MLLDDYNQAFEYYKLCTFTFKIKYYLEKIPAVSRNIASLIRGFVTGKYEKHASLQGQGYKPAREQIIDSLQHTVMSLMMDEFEIVCWVVYIE